MSTVPTNSPFGQPAEPAVVTLTREQLQSKVIDLRDPDGISQGLLVRNGESAVFFTPERLAELRRRAANPGPLKPNREAIDDAMRRAREFHEGQGNKS